MLTTNGIPTGIYSITVIVTGGGNELALSKSFTKKLTKEDVTKTLVNVQGVISDSLFTKKLI